MQPGLHLLRVFPKVRTIILFDVPIRTNLAAVVEYSKPGKDGTSDPILIPEVQEAYSDVEMHDLHVLRGHVLAFKKHISIWVSPGPGKGIKANEIRTRRKLGLKRCKLCGVLLHEDPEKRIIPVLEIRFHRHNCPIVLAYDVMES